MSTKKTENLFEPFKPVDRRDWEESVNRFLDGADYREKLLWNSPEGFSALPLYWDEDVTERQLLPGEPGKPPFTRGTRFIDRDSAPADPHLVEDITAASPAETIQFAHSAVRGGATALRIAFDSSENRNGNSGNKNTIDGIRLKPDSEVIRQLFEVIGPGKTALYIELPAMTSLEADTLPAELFDGTRPHQTFLFDDPLAFGAGSGKWPWNRNGDKIIDSFDRWLADRIRHEGRSLEVNGLYYHNCGAALTQELGLALAGGSEYLARAAENGVSAEKAAQSIHFRLSVSSLYFPEIAKFRAFRFLWCQVATEYGIETGKRPWIHAESSSWNRTSIDPGNNILRATTEVMAAIVGNADSIRTGPYDELFRKPDHFSRRIARNLQHIVRDEARLSQVADPGAGSRYIEVLTDEIGRRAWEFFQKIEKHGGLMRAVEDGVVQKWIKEAAEEKRNAVNRDDIVRIGLNKYQPDEGMQDPLLGNSGSQPAGEDRLPALRFPAELPEAEKDFPTIRPWRLAEPFEQASRSEEVTNPEGGES